jgi:hypothetical protein
VTRAAIAAAVAAGLVALPAVVRAAPGAPPPPPPKSEAAPQPWRAEFDDICARTQDAMTLTVPELKGLIARADALKPRLETLEPSQRKVFVRRLEACRNLYQYVLDARESG